MLQETIMRTALLALMILPAQNDDDDDTLGPLQGVWLTETGPTGDVRIRLEVGRPSLEVG